MTARNTYATLAEYKTFAVARGQTITTDATDDVVIDGLLEDASRFMDDETGRFFYPRVETRYYDVPFAGASRARRFDFKADLLEVISFLNGDATSIASTQYNLIPRNETPKFSLELKQMSTLIWELDSSGNSEYALSMSAFWGYHNRFVDAWKSVGTLGAAITDTTTLAYTMTAGHTLAVGKITKIDNEIGIVGTVSSNTITPLKRGDNGSTATTHSNGASVYTWEPMEQLRNCVLEVALRAYKRRSGQSQGSDSIVTASGAVLPPKDVPAMALKFIDTYQVRVR